MGSRYRIVRFTIGLSNILDGAYVGSLWMDGFAILDTIEYGGDLCERLE